MTGNLIWDLEKPMWPSLAKFVGAKLLTAILVVGTGASLIWFWKHPEHLQAIWATLKGVLIWLGVVIVLPWATFFVPAKIVKLESNVAAAIMLGGYASADVLVALWLGGWSFHGTLTWAVLLLGFLAAGVYNFLVCDYVAERIDDAG
ncbi:MAG: hypothetical protein IID39_08360 [Planctomycetes bacterium]|nr:hypothetical protein [Planctomycetota bacterium]